MLSLSSCLERCSENDFSLFPTLVFLSLIPSKPQALPDVCSSLWYKVGDIDPSTEILISICVTFSQSFDLSEILFLFYTIDDLTLCSRLLILLFHFQIGSSLRSSL